MKYLKITAVASPLPSAPAGPVLVMNANHAFTGIGAKAVSYTRPSKVIVRFIGKNVDF